MEEANFRVFVSQLLLSFYTFLKIIIKSSFRIKLIKSKHKEIVILGNGPSLNNSIEENKDFINNKIKLCVNFFPLSNLYESLEPDIFVTSAPELWRDNVDVIYKTQAIELFRTIAYKTKWKLYFCIPIEAKMFKNWKEIVSKNENIEILYFNNTSIEGFFFFNKFLYKLNLGMPKPHNVLVPSLMLAINMEFDKIYLFGADHSWLRDISVNDNNVVLINQKHFYDVNTSKPMTMHKAGKGQRSLHEVLTKFVFSFRSYFEINKYALRRGQEIYNCTPNSFIDAFERLKL